MHRHLYPVPAAPSVRQRPAKVVALEARRQARAQRATAKPQPPKAA
ncbi:MAG TPA: hypothetical protein VFB25_13500 [Gaiellaceae bacterium]|nr:hypothetical protein [Gaiellaceae bacterium]